MNQKLYKCKECDTEQVILSKGLCNYHRFLSKPSKVRKYINNISQQGIKKRKNKIEKMKPYWEFHLDNIKKHLSCENCGTIINGTVANIAHIIPKRLDNELIFANDLNNYMYLCNSFDGNACHELFDKNQTGEKIYLMSCFKIAYKRYLTFADKCRHNKYVSIFDKYREKNEK